MSVNSAARELVAALQLAPLPREGGFYRQTWRSTAGSAILFLLTPEDFSALHRLRTDEVWHFHAGDPVEHVQLDPRDGSARRLRLGSDICGGELPQLIVPAGMWQGARVLSAAGRVSGPPISDLAARDQGGQVADLPYSAPSTALRAGWSLLGCTLAPPWRDEDFELGERMTLQRLFPAHAELIAAWTR